jgi:hypothetical protein
MPALFSLAIKSSLEHVQTQLWPDEVVRAYLDDIHVLSTPERARAIHDLATGAAFLFFKASLCIDAHRAAPRLRA